jgi:hypothetical protein
MEQRKSFQINSERMNKIMTSQITILVISITLILVIIIFSSFYTYWNSASPEKTCASCHEIGKSINMFAQSAHRELNCKECHGTALSNGFHSLREKGMMVAHHVKNKIVEDIRLNEDQLLAVMDNCKRCHTAEYADWSSGGHSVRYHDILLDRKHNETEQINADCLRCHGMFSDLPVQDLVEPLDKKGPWVLKIPEMADKPVIPCMACHQTHRKGLPKVNPDYSNPGSIFYMREDTSEVVGFYYRPDRSSISAEYLPKLTLWEGERPVRVSDDLLTRNCVQCHSPNASHRAGTSDDRTPRGVHEGIGCMACHNPHSNDARQSCIKCHPAISNCKLDVTTMNTTFADTKSPNNIHWVSCTSCHEAGSPRIRQKR